MIVPVVTLVALAVTGGGVIMAVWIYVTRDGLFAANPLMWLVATGVGAATYGGVMGEAFARLSRQSV